MATDQNEKIFVPYNESTKHIYETFAQVAREIAARQSVDVISS